MKPPGLSYCRKWSLGYREALEPLTEKQAKKAHESGKEYCALLGPVPNRPSHVVHFNRGAILITKLDDLLRSEMVHVFGDPLGEKVFLKSVSGSSYSADSEKANERLVLYFHPDGTGHRHHWLPDGSFEKSDMCWDDMSSHWKPYPKFGQYDEIINAPKAWLDNKHA